MKRASLALVVVMSTATAAFAGTSFPTLPTLFFPSSDGPSVSTQSGPQVPTLPLADQ